SSRLVTLPWRTGSGFRVERGGRAARRGAWSSCAYYASPAAHGGDKGDAQGRLAQWVERLLYTQDVGGSSPSPPTSLRACGAWAGKPSYNCAKVAQRYRRSKRTSIGGLGAGRRRDCKGIARDDRACRHTASLSSLA